MRSKFAAAISILLAMPCIRLAQSQQTQAQQQTRSLSQSAPQDPPIKYRQESPAPVHVDGDVMESKLVHAVPPVYPQIAVMAHVSGTVALHAIVATDGTIRELTFISGPALLRQAAMEAVRQWRFEPTLLNGQPVEVETTIPVNFSLPEWQDTFKFKVTQPGSSRVILEENIDLGGGGKRQDWNDWIAAFEDATSRAWLGGASSDASEKKGKVAVGFTLRSDGKIDGVVAVIHSSRDSVIDADTRLAIQKCVPFQPLPPNPHFSAAVLRVTFSYDHPRPVAPSAGAGK